MNENMEVGNTEHDPPPQASSFPHELIRKDINDSADEPNEVNCFSSTVASICKAFTTCVPVGHSSSADNIQELSSPTFHNSPENEESGDDSSVPFRVLAMPLPDIDDRETVPINLEEFVTVRIKAENDNNDETEYVHKQEAICRICYTNVLEEIKLLGTQCKCKLTLLHETCALEWSAMEENKNCHTCKELIQYIPVTLSTTSGEESHQKAHVGERFPKKFSRLFGRKNG